MFEIVLVGAARAACLGTREACSQDAPAKGLMACIGSYL